MHPATGWDALWDALSAVIPGEERTNRRWLEPKSSLLNFPVLLWRSEAIMAIRRVGGIGAGTMGNGIAHVFARGGLNAVLWDVDQRLLDRVLDTIAKNLDREVARNKITAGNKVSTLGRIAATVDQAQLSECDLGIEAGTGKFEIKG